MHHDNIMDTSWLHHGYIVLCLIIAVSATFCLQQFSIFKACVETDEDMPATSFQPWIWKWFYVFWPINLALYMYLYRHKYLLSGHSPGPLGFLSTGETTLFIRETLRFDAQIHLKSENNSFSTYCKQGTSKDNHTFVIFLLK